MKKLLLFSSIFLASIAFYGCDMLGALDDLLNPQGSSQNNQYSYFEDGICSAG